MFPVEGKSHCSSTAAKTGDHEEVSPGAIETGKKMELIYTTELHAGIKEIQLNFEVNVLTK